MFRECIRLARESSGLSLAQLSDRMALAGVPISDAALGHYETGVRVPASPRVVEALIEALSISDATGFRGAWCEALDGPRVRTSA